MIQLDMQTASVVVATVEGGNRAIIFTDPQSGISVRAVLTPEGARQVGVALSTSLAIAGSPLPKTADIHH